MNSLLIVILIGLGIVFFIAALVIIFLIRRRQAKKRRGLVVQPSFERHLDPRKFGLDVSIAPSTPAADKQPQKRGRLYIFAAIIAAFFGALFVRLWSLQLLNSKQYQQLALAQSYTEVPITPLRGRILDRNGVELVGNRPALSVTAPKAVADDPNTLQRLSLVLGMPLRAIRLKLLDDRVSAQSNRVLATGISVDQAAYIEAHPELFASVEVIEDNYRYYSYGSLAAHLLGYIGPVTQDDLLSDTQGFYGNGDSIGRTGAEQAFEASLRGTKGARSYLADAAGNPTQLIDETPAENGLDVCLTLDLKLQQAVDSILPQIIASAKSIGRIYCDAGAIVCLDVATGGILAASSYPTFYPEVFTQGISQDLWDSMMSPSSVYPLTNRVISGLYPAASTFKAFISMAGMQNGVIDEATTSDCEGLWTGYGKTWAQKCWIYPGKHGVLPLEEAINQSCDVFFYETAARFYQLWQESGGLEVNRPNLLQDYLRSFGFGSVSGLDIGGEAAGRVPDAAWKKSAYSDTPEDAVWQGGDMTSLSIGQGDLLVTPLQICNGYSGVARRGMLQPHVFFQSQDANADVVESYAVRPSTQQPILNPDYIARLENGLSRVVARLGGDFLKLPVAVRGKTGTGEIFSDKETCSWFVAYAPADAPEYCVACLTEQAGTGDSVSLQAVQHVLAAIYGVNIGPVHAGPGTAER